MLDRDEVGRGTIEGVGLSALAVDDAEDDEDDDDAGDPILLERIQNSWTSLANSP